MSNIKLYRLPAHSVSEITIESDLDLERAKPLIQQSYEAS